MAREDEGREGPGKSQSIDDDSGMSRHSSEAQSGAIPDSSQDTGSAAGDVQEQGLAGEAKAPSDGR